MTQPDTIITIQDNTIHHGHYSNRAYLMKLGGDARTAAQTLVNLSLREGYSKAVAKIPVSALDMFMDEEFEEEARVPCMYTNGTDGVFVARYFTCERRDEPFVSVFEGVHSKALAKATTPARPLEQGYRLVDLVQEDVTEIGSVFQAVFPRYPFPVHEEAFLLQTMQEGTKYFGVRLGNELVAVSSAEVDTLSGNAEMTDFATLPAHRGKGFASALLHEMEGNLQTCGITTAYTIARSASIGMNIAFARSGYEFGGRLLNNTCIADGIESMNVWWKFLE